MRISALYYLLVVTFITASCKLLQGPKTGDISFKEYQYTTAAGLYEKELETEKDPKEVARKSYQVAECYRLSGNYTKATSWYKKAADAGADPESIFMYAEMLKMNEDYDEAITQFKNYLKAKPDDDEKTNAELRACQLSKEWRETAGEYRIRNASSLNSAAFDYAPVQYKKGLVFTSDRPDANGDAIYGWTGQHYSDIYYSERDAAGNLTPPASFSKTINTPYNEGVITFNKEYNECYFTRCGSSSTTDDYCKIYHSTWNAEISDWGAAEEVELFKSDSINVAQPSLSPDGNDLYFSANPKDAYGGKDIYVSHKNVDGTWSDPENLGSNINTPGDEKFPHLGNDGKLYFSSDGWPGMGGLDIFVAERKGNGWGKPVNLRYPINSGADDFGILIVPLIKNEKDSLRLKGYFTSNRPGGKGNDDIYEFVLKRNKFYQLRGVVYEKKLLDPTDPNSQIIGLKPLKNSRIVITEYDTTKKKPTDVPPLLTDSTGRFALQAKTDCRYVIKATNEPDFFAKTEYANTKGYSKMGKDTVYNDFKVYMDRIPRADTAVAGGTGGAGWRINNVYYGLDSFNLRPLSKRVLDTLYTKLMENPKLIVELGSHTDCRGTHEHNMELSQNRAQTAVDYLIAKGIEKDRITAKGYGETTPVEPCPDCKKCTEEQHQRNRRTTLKVIGIKDDVKPEKK